MDIAHCLQFGRDALRDTSPSADLDAQLLLGFILSLSRLKIITDSKEPVSKQDFESFKKLLDRRKNSEPVAYITGRKEFWGIEFEVNPNVLVPRPDTELLVDVALTYSADLPDPLVTCDLGTGSGCIAVSLAFEWRRRRRNFFILACDKSLEALKIAKRNIIENKLENEIRLVCSDWNSPIAQDFDLVLSNPPYLFPRDIDRSRELGFEPALALYSGHDGLDDYRKIFSNLPTLLSKNGVFLGEIGYGQAHMIEHLVKDIIPTAKIQFHDDIRKIQRVVEVRIDR